MISLRVALEAWTGSPSRVAPRSRRGVHSDSHRSGSRHSGDGLAVAGHRAAHGSGRWVPRVVSTGPTGPRAVPIARARMPFSRNFKSVSARSVRGWSQAFSGGIPSRLLALPSRGQGARVQVGLLPRVQGRLMSGVRMDHLWRRHRLTQRGRMVTFHPQKKTYSFRNLQDVNLACSSTAGWRHRATAHSYKSIPTYPHNQLPHPEQSSQSLGSSKLPSPEGLRAWVSWEEATIYSSF